MRLPTTLAIAVLAGPALAAPPAPATWSPTTLLDTGGRPALSPQLSPARGGAATVLLKDGRAAAARATVGADGSTSRFAALGAPYTVAGADARGRALLAHVNTKLLLRLRSASPDGEVSRGARLAFGATSVSVAVNRAGDAVLAARVNGRVVAATGTTRAGFGALQTLSGGGALAVDTAIDAEGDGVVAFVRNGRLRVADRPADGDRFERSRLVGTSAMAEQPELEVALGDEGAALVAYTDGRRFLAATREAPGAFDAPQLLEDGLTGVGLRPDGAVVGDTAFLAYGDEDRTMQFTQGPVDGTLDAPRQVSSAGAAVGDLALAASAAGDVAVVFTEDFVARAAVQPAGATMGAPETIDTADADAITMDVVPSGSGRFIAAVETGGRAKASRQVRISTFAR